MASKKFRDNTKLLIIGVGAFVGLGVFGYMQLSTTTVYVAESAIMSNTMVTEDMLSSGMIKPKSVPRSLTNEASIKNFEDISGKYLKFPLGPGKMIFTYDFAGESDIRNNEILRNQNLEALSLYADSVTNAVSNLSINDRINLYSTETIDISMLSQEDMVVVGTLPEDVQKIFIDAGGLTPEDKVAVGEYKYSKMIAQNVPVVEVDKDLETGAIKEFMLGVTPNISESIYLSIEDGTLAFNILPYSETEYKVKDSKGSLENLQIIAKTSSDDKKE